MERKSHREPPFLIPREMTERKFVCSRCGASNQVNWYRKQASSLQSVEGTTEAKGFWVRSSFKNDCAACGSVSDLPVTRWSAKSRFSIYADEAYREECGVRTFVIAGCGVQQGYLPRLERQVTRFETELKSISGGSIERFHAKDIMGCKLPSGDRIKLINSMSSFCRSDRISKLVVVYYAIEPVSQKFMRDITTSFFMMFALWLCRKNQIVPKFYFDRTQSNKRNGWIEECFTGLKRSPLFIDMAGGNHIEQPVDVDPLSTIQSKLSDCIAFSVAREIAKIAAEMSSDVSTARLGKLHSAFFADGDVTYGCARGFPSKPLVKALIQNLQ